MSRSTEVLPFRKPHPAHRPLGPSDSRLAFHGDWVKEALKIRVGTPSLTFGTGSYLFSTIKSSPEENSSMARVAASGRKQSVGNTAGGTATAATPSRST